MGVSETKLYRRWWTMMGRCDYPNTPYYKDYGGRGIKVCYEWHRDNPQGWENFKRWMLSQGYDENLPRGAQTIDRIDVNKGYEPNNCRLISNFEQQGNTRKNVYITYNGETHHVAEWARRIGVTRSCLLDRLKVMSPKEAIERPLFPSNTTYHFEYNGKIYDTLTDVANDCGLKMKRLSYLIHRGMTVNEAIKSELQRQKTGGHLTWK
jgi:hypothetical protein